MTPPPRLVTYRRVDSPIGQLLLAATERGLVYLAFANEDHDAVLAKLAAVPGDSPVLAQAATELAEYFAGRRRTFAVLVDDHLSTGFRKQIQDLLPRIDYGATQTYKQLAEAAGNPRAVRAVGTACAANPVPIIVPCHRVLRSDGSLGGYRGGVEAKEMLLSLESGALEF